MKAITIREFGGPDVLRMEELPTPVPAADEVLIRVHSVSVNQTLDLKVRAGVYRQDLQAFDCTPPSLGKKALLIPDPV